MLNLSRHENYKDSGIKSLGEIPSDWGLKKLKYMARIKNGQDHKKNELDEPGYPVIGSGGRFAYASKYLFSGESVLLGRKGTIDKPLYINGSFWTVDTMFYTQIYQNTFPKFFYYSSLTIPFGYYSTNTAVPSMTQEDLGNHVFVFPPLEDQKRIADFLDRKTAEIDQAIAQKQRLIELLKEQKAILIDRIITKGLSPNTPTRNSGSDWMREIPEHWSVSRIGFIAKVGNGSTPNRANIAYWNNGSIPWLNSSKVNDIFIYSADQFITKKAVRECHLPIVKPNSIVLAITGEGKTRGTAAICKIETAINQHLAYVEISSKCILPEFLLVYLQAMYGQMRFESSGSGSTKGAITCDDIKKYKVPIPPLKEQEEILDSISQRFSDFNETIGKMRECIDQLAELKQVFISNVITGKIKV
jgi:type I restriction enzyme, S subunit